MTLTKRPVAFFACALIGLSVLESAFANDRTEEKIRVQFAILLDRDDPIAGNATCIVGKNCRLLEQKEPRLDLSLKIYRDRDYLASELKVDCVDRCSFSSGRSTTTFHGTRQFDFFEGEDGVEIPLVLRPREKIGRILLIYQ